ncbi:MAG: hypothetical protein ACK5LC_04820 [Coprobacillaceae bacterium]
MKYDILDIKKQKINDIFIQMLYVNNQSIGGLLNMIVPNKQYTSLSVAWRKDLMSQQESAYIQDLLDNRLSVNLPILLCPDDLDFSCTVIVAKVRYLKESVVWDKIGVVNWKNFKQDKWRTSGYQDYTTWNDGDWKKYGDIYSNLDSDNSDWHKLWKEEWPEEEKRRIWNYYHPYFNDDNNIDWVINTKYEFNIDEYQQCIAQCYSVES